MDYIGNPDLGPIKNLLTHELIFNNVMANRDISRVDIGLYMETIFWALLKPFYSIHVF